MLAEYALYIGAYLSIIYTCISNTKIRVFTTHYFRTIGKHFVSPVHVMGQRRAQIFSDFYLFRFIIHGAKIARARLFVNLRYRKSNTRYRI